MKGFLLAVALLAAGISHEARGQDRLAATPLKTALADLDRLVPTRTVATAQAGRPEPDRLRAAVDWLNRNYERTNPDNVSDEYVRTLQRAGTLLSQQPSAEMIEDVTLELEANPSYWRAGEPRVRCQLGTTRCERRRSCPTGGCYAQVRRVAPDAAAQLSRA
jgi:hypothetical protein